MKTENKKQNIFMVPYKLYFKYFLDIFRLLIFHPTIIPKLFTGPPGYVLIGLKPKLSNLIQEEFAKKPRGVTHSHGFDIFLNPKDAAISPLIEVLGCYDGKTTTLFNMILKKSSKECCCVVDVGANIGWFTLLAARITQNNGIVFSFEPEPTNFSLLSKSVERNQFRNVHLFQKCVLDVDGTQELYLSPSKNAGLHTVMKDLGGSKIVVSSIKLDSLLSYPKFDCIYLLKIDVEGAEAKVLAGAQELFAQSKIKHILMEWNPEVWIHYMELFNSLFYNFDVYQIVFTLPFLYLRKLPENYFPKSQLNLYLRSKKLKFH